MLLKKFLKGHLRRQKQRIVQFLRFLPRKINSKYLRLIMKGSRKPFTDSQQGLRLRQTNTLKTTIGSSRSRSTKSMYKSKLPRRKNRCMFNFLTEKRLNSGVNSRAILNFIMTISESLKRFLRRLSHLQIDLEQSKQKRMRLETQTWQ